MLTGIAFGGLISAPVQMAADQTRLQLVTLRLFYRHTYDSQPQWPDFRLEIEGLHSSDSCCGRYSAV